MRWLVSRGRRCERLLLVGLGKREKLDVGNFRKAMGAGCQGAPRLERQKCRHLVAGNRASSERTLDLRWIIRQSVEIIESVLYKFVRMKKESDDKPLRLSAVTFLIEKSHKRDAELGLREGEAIGYGMRVTRDLANLPGNVCTPAYLGREAEKLASRTCQA